MRIKYKIILTNLRVSLNSIFYFSLLHTIYLYIIIGEIVQKIAVLQ